MKYPEWFQSHLGVNSAPSLLSAPGCCSVCLHSLLPLSPPHPHSDVLNIKVASATLSPWLFPAPKNAGYCGQSHWPWLCPWACSIKHNVLAQQVLGPVELIFKRVSEWDLKPNQATELTAYQKSTERVLENSRVYMGISPSLLRQCLKVRVF